MCVQVRVCISRRLEWVFSHRLSLSTLGGRYAVRTQNVLTAWIEEEDASDEWGLFMAVLTGVCLRLDII